VNRYYKSEEEFVFALAEAMRVEYHAITDAGFLLQVDDAWLAALWDRIGVTMGLEAYKRYCALSRSPRISSQSVWDVECSSSGQECRDARG